MTRSGGVGTALLTLLLAACTGDPADEDAAAIANAFLDRAARGDVAAALSLLDADVVVRLPEEPPLMGIEAAGGWLRWDSTLAVRRWPAEPTDPAAGFGQDRAPTGATLPRAEGARDTIRLGRLRESSLELALLGRAEVARSPGSLFVIEDGRIRAISLTGLEPEARAARDAALADFLPWARHEYPERLLRIRTDGRFERDARGAADWLALLREWRAGSR